MARLPFVTATTVFLALLVASGFAQRRYQTVQSYSEQPRQQVYNQQQPQTFTSRPQQQLLQPTPPRSSSASCPEKNGRFPVASQCDAYIECIDGIAEEKLCPEGLLFNPDARFNYPCGYPIDVDCAGRPKLQTPKPSEDCPHQYGYFKVGDRVNCGQFMNCADGKGYIFNCPEGLAFNAESYRCDWPDQVADCDAEAFLGFSCPPPGEGIFRNGEIRYFRSPRDCEHYYICVDNRPRLQSCGEGNAFSVEINACDAAENVTGCAIPEYQNKAAGQTRLF